MTEYCKLDRRNPQILPTSWEQHHGLSWSRERDRAILMDAGYREVTASEMTEPPKGKRLAYRVYKQDPRVPHGAVEIPVWELIPDLAPEPSVVVIDFDSKTGEPSGKTYRGMCIDGEWVTTQNSASPVLPGTEQLEAAISIKKDRDDLRGRAGKVETAANAAGNSVPALRAVVAELARIVKER